MKFDNKQNLTTIWAMEQSALRSLVSSKKLFERHEPRAAAKQQAAAAPAYSTHGGTAVIPVVGTLSKYPGLFDDLLGGCSTLEIHEALDAAVNDPQIDAIVLYFDSTGGQASGICDLGNAIIQTKAIKPVTAYISDHCCSGAYWLAAQCSKIYANESAIIGSIGVYSVVTDYSQAAEAEGLKINLVSAGEFKGLGEPGLPIDAKYLGQVQSEVDAIYDLFVNAVSSGRNLPISSVTKLADGSVHIASEAVSLGLIDAIASLQVAINLQGNSMTDNKKTDSAPAPSPVAAPAAPAGDDMQKQMLALLQQILEKLSSDDDSDEPDDGNPDEADDMDSDPEAAKAAEAERMKAINEACPNSEAFAIRQFLAGKSALEAKAAFSDHLLKENAELRKKVSSDSDGINPLNLGGGSHGTSVDSNDAEEIWAKNIDNVHKTYRGKKEYFLQNHKYNLAQAAKKEVK